MSEQNNEESPERLWRTVADYAGLLAIAAAPLLVMFSIVNSWAYFSVVDPAMLRVITLSDQINFALHQLPVALISFAIVALVLGVSVRRRIIHKTGSAIGGQLDRLVEGSRIHKIIYVVILLAVALLIYWIPSMGAKVMCGFLYFAVVVLSVMIFVTDRLGYTSKVMLATGAVGGFFLYASLGVFVGLEDAIGDLHNVWPDHKIVLAKGASIESAIVLRSTDAGIYFRDLNTGTQRFVMWSEVSEVQNLKSPPLTGTLIVCRLLSLC